MAYNFQTITFQRDQTIVKIGQTFRSFYLISKGQASVIIKRTNKQRKKVQGTKEGGLQVINEDEKSEKNINYN